MFPKAEMFRRLAGLLCASMLLSSCGMIVEDSQYNAGGVSAPVSTSANTSSQTSVQTDTAASSADASAGVQTESDSGSSVPSAETTTQSAAASSASDSVQTTAASKSSSSAAATTASAPTSASTGSSSGTTGSSASSSSTTTTGTTSAVIKTGKLTESDQAFLADCVFVGDSICSGLSVYKILSASHVVAKGNVGVRSIFDYTFKVNGSSCNVVQALSALKPKYVVFSMGMNDINMTNSQKYCENYKNLLTKVQAALPSAKLYVASITPITTTSKFTTNTKIDSYNSAIRTYLASNYPSWGYVDVASSLKNEWNALRSNYTSGDGIHLSPDAYKVMLSAVCKQLAP